MTKSFFSLDYFKGIMFCMLLFIGSFCSLLALLPAVLSIPIHSVLAIQIRRAYTNWITGIFLDSVVSLIAIIGQTKVYIYCDDPSIIYKPHSNKQNKILNHTNTIATDPLNLLNPLSTSFQPPVATVIMSNYRTSIDYLFSGFCYGMLTNRNENMKLIVRDFFRSVPLIGWGMQCMMYIFLNDRKNAIKSTKDSDVSTIAQTFDYLLQLQVPIRFVVHFKKLTSWLIPKPSLYPLSVLVWPEGSFFSKHNKERSNACKYTFISFLYISIIYLLYASKLQLLQALCVCSSCLYVNC